MNIYIIKIFNDVIRLQLIISSGKHSRPEVTGSTNVVLDMGNKNASGVNSVKCCLQGENLKTRAFLTPSAIFWLQGSKIY